MSIHLRFYPTLRKETGAVTETGVEYPRGVSLPRVSVLLPVFNGAEYLKPCLESLERQTLSDFEVVAVDDGSTDDSGKILKNLAGRDRRFRVLQRAHHGLIPTLNEGLQECRSSLVARMDADDIAHPQRLRLQVDLLEDRPEVAVASSLVQHFPSHRIRDGFRLYDQWINSLLSDEAMRRERFVESPVAHPSVMFRREVVATAGGYRDRGWPEDYDLWLRLFESGKVFAKVPRILLFWRERSTRLSRIDPRYSARAFLRCKAHFFARGPGAEGNSIVLWGAGPNGKKLHRFLGEEGVVIKAVIDIDPSKIGGRIRGTSVLPPDALPGLLDKRTVVVTAVASRGARQLIRSRLVSLDLCEGQGFWCLL
jgi:glycosyltransferase involved in cell wall biosynthesis